MEEEGFIQYRTKSGRTFLFDQKRAAKQFGVDALTRAETPKGPATVIGVYNDNLWFHIDGDAGATYWDNLRNYQDFVTLGFCVLEEEGDSQGVTVVEDDKRSISKDLESLVLKETFHDVTLVVGEDPREFKAHRAILSARSKFFEALFCSNMKDSQKNSLRLPQVSSAIFPDVMHYLYTDRTTTNDIVGLYEAASFLQIDSLIKILELELQRGISLSNVVSMLGVAKDLDIPALQICCQKFIVTHASILLKKEKYSKTISFDVLEFMLKSDEIWTTEKELLDCLLDWGKINKNPDNVKKLLPLIRYEFLSLGDLESISKCEYFSPQELTEIMKQSTNNQNSNRKPRAKYREEQ